MEKLDAAQLDFVRRGMLPPSLHLPPVAAMQYYSSSTTDQQGTVAGSDGCSGNDTALVQSNASCDGQVRVVDDGDVGDADDLLNNSGLDIANANANVPSNLLRLPSDITLAKTPGMHAIS